MKPNHHEAIRDSLEHALDDDHESLKRAVKSALVSLELMCMHEVAQKEIAKLKAGDISDIPPILLDKALEA